MRSSNKAALIGLVACSAAVSTRRCSAGMSLCQDGRGACDNAKKMAPMKSSPLGVRPGPTPSTRSAAASKACKSLAHSAASTASNRAAARCSGNGNGWLCSHASRPGCEAPSSPAAATEGSTARGAAPGATSSAFGSSCIQHSRAPAARAAASPHQGAGCQGCQALRGWSVQAPCPAQTMRPCRRA